MTNLSKELCEVCNFSTLFFNPENETLTRVYPDFEKPKNFVKLLEIINKKMCIGSLLICNLYYEYSFIKEFLRLLKRFLNGELEYGKSAINEIKQAIKDEEWVYE